jgi:scyllo-inositol 2-dehydrogenase (NADP+)
VTTTKRVGLIGYGLAGRVFHAPLVSAEPSLDVAVVVTSNAERAAAARADLPGASIVPTADDLFGRAEELDLVVVAAANRVHVPLAMAAFEHGLPVVVDKPLAPTAADAQRLVDAAAERGTWLTVFQNRRWDSDFLTLRSLVDGGDLGEIRRFESRFERWRPALKGGWRESGNPEEVGGLLYDLGAHLVDQTLVLFGPASMVYAEVDTRRPGAESDDDTFVALTHTSGVRSHLFASATAAHLGPRFRVLGADGAYVVGGLDGQEDALRSGQRPGAGWAEVPEDHWGRRYAGDDVRPVRTLPGQWPVFYQEVAAALRGEGPPPVDPRDAVASIRVLEAANESARLGEVITLG